MAYGVPEYPGSNLSSTDFTELIRLYKKLIAEYDDFVTRLGYLETRMTELEEHIDEILDKKLESVYAQFEQIKARQVEIENEINALERFVNTKVAQLEKDVVDEVKKLKTYVNSETSALRQEVTTQIRDAIADVNRQITFLREWTESYVAEELSRFDEVLVKLDTDIVNLKDYVDLQDSKNTQLIRKEIARLEQKLVDITVDQVWVVNPVDGVVGNIQDVLNDMWKHTNLWSLTAEEYAWLDITAEEYADWPLYMYGRRGLTAWEYAWLGKWYLAERGGIIKEVERLNIEWIEHCTKMRNDLVEEFEKFKRDVDRQITMFSPFTGRKESVVKVVEDIVPFINTNGLTADEYAGLDLSAQQYADLDITAYEYAWLGLLIMNREFGFERYTGLTASEYSKLGVDRLGHVVIA